MWGCCRGLHGLARTSQDCPALLAYLTCPAQLKGQAQGHSTDHCAGHCARPSARPIVAGRFHGHRLTPSATGAKNGSDTSGEYMQTQVLTRARGAVEYTPSALCGLYAAYASCDGRSLTRSGMT